jgi:hypothetical protein
MSRRLNPDIPLSLAPDLRTEHGLDLAWLKTLFDLLDEVERLRAELRFFRNR